MKRKRKTEDIIHFSILHEWYISWMWEGGYIYNQTTSSGAFHELRRSEPYLERCIANFKLTLNNNQNIQENSLKFIILVHV